MKTTSTVLFFLLSITIWGQPSQKIKFNTIYPEVRLDEKTALKYILHFEKGGVYKVSVLQQGIDAVVLLTDQTNKQLIEKDSPNGTNGLETFNFTSNETGDYYLTIKRFEQDGNPREGKVTINIKQFSKTELKEIAKFDKETEQENKKSIQTIDIDHFWEAFDDLKKCQTRFDSIMSFQKLYIDRATNGLKDFIIARHFSADNFVNAVSAMPKFYNSIRKNTLEAKNAAPIIDGLVLKFKEIYPNFKPFKICFAIGLVNTGGTVSENFLLIGTEVSTSIKSTDLSEFNNNAYSQFLAYGDDVVQKIMNMVSHEYVHTQQPKTYDENAIKCPLLMAVMREGFCDFIGELIVGSQINKVAHEYGDLHEKELWNEIKNEMCNEKNIKNWLFNYSSVKGRPADLGYYIGYKIAKEYFDNATDKKQAVIDIIEMKDPIKFLQISKYDQKEKK